MPARTCAQATGARVEKCPTLTRTVHNNGATTQHASACATYLDGARHFRRMESLAEADHDKCIDVYIRNEWEGEFSGSNSLMLQLATIIKGRPKQRAQGWRLRVVLILDTPSEGAKERMLEKLANARINDAQVLVIISSDVHAAILANSSRSSLIFLPMPPLPENIHYASRGHAIEKSLTYIKSLDKLTEDLPPIALVAAGERVDVLTTAI